MQKLEEVLQQLSEIEPGWFDGEGEKPSPEALIQSRALLMHCQQHSLPLPQIGANVRGAIVLSWTHQKLVAQVFPEHATVQCGREQLLVPRDSLCQQMSLLLK
jgi:hypothetical protein